MWLKPRFWVPVKTGVCESIVVSRQYLQISDSQSDRFEVKLMNNKNLIAKGWVYRLRRNNFNRHSLQASLFARRD
jgi:hypothetical protein